MLVAWRTVFISSPSPTPWTIRPKTKAAVSLRIGAEFHDEDDVRYLLRHLDIQSYEDAVVAISRYYPLERFPQKTLYALAELLPSRA